MMVISTAITYPKFKTLLFPKFHVNFYFVRIASNVNHTQMSTFCKFQINQINRKQDVP